MERKEKSKYVRNTEETKKERGREKVTRNKRIEARQPDMQTKGWTDRLTDKKRLEEREGKRRKGKRERKKIINCNLSLYLSFCLRNNTPLIFLLAP